MKSKAFDMFALQMKSQWDAEERAFRRLEEGAARFWNYALSVRSGAALALPGALCAVDERLKP